jgi:hypothetical protein
MGTQVIITGITGTEPYNIWVSDTCPNESIQIYIDTINNIDLLPPDYYTFQIPQPFENTNFCLKIIDSNNCIICSCIND